MSSIFQQYRSQKYEIQIPKASVALVFGSLLTFFGGILILFGFASPYWLASWEYTFSPFKNMGLWEFCFKDYRHPHFQFDKLFNGCHYIFSEEYRIIREWMLPGWLMVVQTFYTLAFMSSFGTQIILAFLIIRWPLKLTINYGWFFALCCAIANVGTAFLIFLAVSVFGGQCFRRDWLQYPNFNYLSWAYAFAVIAMFIHLFAALILWSEYKDALEKYREGDGHQEIQMHPSGNGNERHGRESVTPSVGISNPASSAGGYSGSVGHHFV